MKIYIIRHSETKHNKERLFQGWKDTELSKKGINDAKNKAKNFPQDFDVCFSSTLKRAKDTAKILVPYLDIIYDKRIMERKLGEYEGTIVTQDKLRALDLDKPPKDAESVKDIDDRVIDFINTLKSDYKDKKVLVVTHAGTVLSFMRVLHLSYFGLGNLEMKEIEI